MRTLYPLDPTKRNHAFHGGEWSLRRSAAFVVAGGLAFWAIVIALLLFAR